MFSFLADGKIPAEMHRSYLVPTQREDNGYRLFGACNVLSAGSAPEEEDSN